MASRRRSRVHFSVVFFYYYYYFSFLSQTYTHTDRLDPVSYYNRRRSYYFIFFFYSDRASRVTYIISSPGVRVIAIRDWGETGRRERKEDDTLAADDDVCVEQQQHHHRSRRRRQNAACQSIHVRNRELETLPAYRCPIVSRRPSVSPTHYSREKKLLPFRLQVHAFCRPSTGI